jgi:hypothetical protein
MSEEQTPAGPRWTPARVVVALLIVVGVVIGLSLIKQHNSGGADDADVPTGVATSEQVQYRLWGSATGADLTWSTGGSQLTQATGKAVPVMGKNGRQGIVFQAPVGASLYFSAQNTGAAGDLTCEILVDGRSVARNTSSGGYSIVECVG